MGLGPICCVKTQQWPSASLRHGWVRALKYILHKKIGLSLRYLIPWIYHTDNLFEPWSELWRKYNLSNRFHINPQTLINFADAIEESYQIVSKKQNILLKSFLVCLFNISNSKRLVTWWITEFIFELVLKE